MNNAPMSSTPKVKITTFRAVFKTSLSVSCAMKFWTFKPSLNEDPPRKKKAKNEVKVKIPKPPICIKLKIMVCPSKVKSLAVSSTINPVTHTALVDVNKASVKEIPAVVAFGSNNKNAPIKIMAKKLPTKTMAGL